MRIDAGGSNLSPRCKSYQVRTDLHPYRVNSSENCYHCFKCKRDNIQIFVMRRQISFLLLLSTFALTAYGQTKPLKLLSPRSDSSVVENRITYLRGLGDPSASLWLDDEEVTIYKTGAFAAAISLEEGRNESVLTYVKEGDTLRRHLIFERQVPAPVQPTEGFAISYANVLPGGDLWVRPGDALQVEMKATPGLRATFMDGTPLQEVDTAIAGVAGIYRGEYFVKESDTLDDSPIRFQLHDDASGRTISTFSREKVRVLSQPHALIGTTTGRNIQLSYGLGTDRLGGAKMGFLDQGVKLEINGLVGDMYRVRLSSIRQAYIPVGNLQILPGVHFRPSSLVGSWSVSPDEGHDVVRLRLDERLPYTSVMRNHERLIVVDIYGAVSNTNWITQKQNLQAIQNVWYEQVEKDMFRVFIELKNDVFWGYGVGYEGSQLVIRVKPQPEKLALEGLTVAVDAGHGGSNRGAVSMTGVLEKDLNLEMALKLRRALLREGARVVMTRESDRSVNNAFRVQWAREQNPDILISIHCNASANPMAQGASTFYKHHALRGPSQYIYEEMLTLGLADYGNVGGFNFMLNAPTEFPTVLVETAFMSNPADEEKLVDPEFHTELAESIVRGLKKYLKAVKEG